MIPSFAASVRTAIQQRRMLRAGDRVAVAVSGGADSVALLRLLDQLRGDLGITLCVAHLNHQLRSADSDSDEDFVATLARQRGFVFIVAREDVASVAKQRGWNLEDAARRLRYDFFAKIVADGRAACVATAHTADDQAETVLARLIRGTGLTGLGSIYPVRGGVIRPLLEVRRSDLRNYLVALNQEWREDATNADTQRLRVRVRQRLLPEMEQNFSSSIVSKLSELAALARDEEEFWKASVKERCSQLVTKAGENSSITARDLLWPMGDSPQERFAGKNPFRALTQRIVRHLYAGAGPSHGELSRSHVEQVIRLTEKSTGRCLELPGGVRVRKEFDRLVFTSGGYCLAKPTPPESVSYAYSIELPTRGSVAVSVPELGRCFRLKVIDWPNRERETTCEGVVLDAERLRSPLILRNWKSGDAYCPRGRRRLRKVTRMLSAGCITAAQRALWPVLTSAGSVVWVDQMPVAAEFSASEATRTGVWIFDDGR